MGSVYVEPRESSRTFRFSFCLASQKCNGGSLVFEQIEGFEYLIPGEEPSDDSDKPTEGAVSSFFFFFFFFCHSIFFSFLFLTFFPL